MPFVIPEDGPGRGAQGSKSLFVEVRVRNIQTGEQALFSLCLSVSLSISYTHVSVKKYRKLKICGVFREDAGCSRL